MWCVLVLSFSSSLFQVFSDGPVAPGAPLLWDGPFEGYTTPSKGGESDKMKLVQEHLAVWKEQVLTMRRGEGERGGLFVLFL